MVQFVTGQVETSGAWPDYGFGEGEGLYTDMNAIRPDEESLDSIYTRVYVDQWDWEKVISRR